MRWRLSPALLCLTALAACADSAPPADQGGEGAACAETFECDPGLFCLGQLCQRPRQTGNNDGPDLSFPDRDQGSPDPDDLGGDDLGGEDLGGDDLGGEDLGGEDAPDRPDMEEGPCPAGQDSDGDGANNEDEGDADPDGDGLPSCRDLDSDNDGLTDREEREDYHSDPLRQDSDGDGAWDLLEVAAGSALDNPASQPDPSGELVVLPAGQDQVQLPLVFSSQVQRSDVYFLMDTSTTMDQEISNLKRTLTQTLIPGLRERLEDVSFGVGHFDDFAQAPYGNNPDFRAYEHLQDITSDDARVVAAINGLQTCCAVGDGTTFPEAHTVALWGTASGLGLGRWFPPREAECEGKGGLGYPCFRLDALPIIVLITDASYHNGPNGAAPYSGISPSPPSFQQAIQALNGIGAKVVSIVSNGGDLAAYSHAEATATQTQTLSGEDSSPLVYRVNAQGEGLDGRILDAFGALTGNVRRDVHAEGFDPDDEDNEDTARFVLGAEPIGANPSGGVEGIQGDRFLAVVPGTALTFRVTFGRADVPAQGADGEHRFFRVVVRALGDGAVLLDERTIYLAITRQGATISAP